MIKSCLQHCYGQTLSWYTCPFCARASKHVTIYLKLVYTTVNVCVVISNFVHILNYIWKTVFLLAPKKVRAISQFTVTDNDNNNFWLHFNIKLFWKSSKFQVICQQNQTMTYGLEETRTLWKTLTFFIIGVKRANIISVTFPYLYFTPPSPFYIIARNDYLMEQIFNFYWSVKFFKT